MNQNSTIITTAPGIENLEWLKFSFTQGMPRALVEGSLLTSAGYERYRYATNAETESLLKSYCNAPIDKFYNPWTENNALPANTFLSDFGITKVIFPNNQPGSLDLDNGNFVTYDMLRLSNFYYGAYGTDIDSNVDPPYVLGGEVGEALYGVGVVAGKFAFGEMYGINHKGREHFASLLVREHILDAPGNFEMNS